MISELAAAVSAQLREDGIESVVVGASAAASYAPDACEITEIDFAVPTGVNRRSIAQSVVKLGFRPSGRFFVRDGGAYALHFSSGPAERVVKRSIVMETDAGSYKNLALLDAIADCAAGFIHWNDGQSLELAERFARALRGRIIDSRLLEALGDVEPSDAAARQRLTFAERRLKAALR